MNIHEFINGVSLKIRHPFLNDSFFFEGIEAARQCRFRAVPNMEEIFYGDLFTLVGESAAEQIGRNRFGGQIDVEDSLIHGS